MARVSIRTRSKTNVNGNLKIIKSRRRVEEKGKKKERKTFEKKKKSGIFLRGVGGKGLENLRKRKRIQQSKQERNNVVSKRRKINKNNNKKNVKMNKKDSSKTKKEKEKTMQPKDKKLSSRDLDLELDTYWHKIGKARDPKLTALDCELDDYWALKLENDKKKKNIENSDMIATNDNTEKVP